MKAIPKFIALVVTLLLATVSFAQSSASADILVRTNFNSRLREAPVATSRILDTIPRGTTLVAEALTVDKGWIQVTFRGQTGWVAARLVQFVAPRASRAANPGPLVRDGNWTLTLDGAFSCLSFNEAINVPNFVETVSLTALNRFTALEINGRRFTQGRTVTMDISGTTPPVYVGTFTSVLGGSANSAVEVTLVFEFEVINNRRLEGSLINVTVKRGGASFECVNGDYRALLVRN